MTDLFAYVEKAKAAGRQDLALLEFGDLIDMRLGGIEPFHRRADLLRAMGRKQEARDDYHRAAVLDPRNPWPWLWMAGLSVEQGLPLLAAADIDEALRRDPDALEIRVNAARIFGALNWLDRAWAAVREAPADMGGWWGEARHDAERHLRAHRGFTQERLQERRSGPLDTGKWLALAEELLKVGRVGAARTLCERLMAVAPHEFPPAELYARIVARAEGAAAAHAFLRAVHFLHGGRDLYRRAVADMARQIAPPTPEIRPATPPPLPGR